VETRKNIKARIIWLQQGNIFRMKEYWMASIMPARKMSWKQGKIKARIIRLQQGNIFSIKENWVASMMATRKKRWKQG
jgi:hypothetical protein